MNFSLRRHVTRRSRVDGAHGPGAVRDVAELVLELVHGYGVRIVDSIVQKYNGQISRSIENGKYRVDIMLDLRWAENVS